MTRADATGATEWSDVHGPSETKQAFREVMGRYATGAAIVTATNEGRPHGLAVNSFTSVSLDPPLVSFCPAKRSDTWPAIREAPYFGVNILACEQSELCQQFARKGEDRFRGISYSSTPRGCPALPETLAYLECQIEQIIDAGDHYIAIAHVLDMGMSNELRPLVFYQGGYHRLERAGPAI